MLKSKLPLQSGFILGNLTIYQLPFHCNTSCQAFDSGKEARFVFYDTGKAFGRVWHPDFYINSCIEALARLINYPSDRKFKVLHFTGLSVVLVFHRAPF